MNADRDIERKFARTYSDLSFEPLTFAGDQIDHSNRRVQHLRCQPRNIVKLRLGRRIQDAIELKRSCALVGHADGDVIAFAY